MKILSNWSARPSNLQILINHILKAVVEVQSLVNAGHVLVGLVNNAGDGSSKDRCSCVVNSNERSQVRKLLILSSFY